MLVRDRGELRPSFRCVYDPALATRDAGAGLSGNDPAEVGERADRRALA
jgi:hypothetical protein